MIRILSLILTSTLLTGCLATRTVQNQTITIDTPMLAGASCDLTDVRGNKWYLDETPGTVTVLKGYGPITVICEKEGYKRTVVTIEDRYGNPKDYQHMATATAMLMFDPTANIGKKFPNKLVVLMEPKKFASEQNRIDWLAAKHSYEKMYQEERNAERVAKIEEAQKRHKKKVADALRKKKEQQAQREKAEDSTVRRSATAERIKRIKKGLNYRNEQRNQGAPKAISNNAPAQNKPSQAQQKNKTIGQLSAEEKRQKAWKDAFSDKKEGTLIIKQVPKQVQKKDFSKNAAPKNNKPKSVIASEAVPAPSKVNGKANAQARAESPKRGNENNKRKVGKLPKNPNEPIPLLVPGQ